MRRGDGKVRKLHVPGTQEWTGRPPRPPGTSDAGRTGSSVPDWTSVGWRPAAWTEHIPRDSAMHSFRALEDRPHWESGRFATSTDAEAHCATKLA